MPVCDIHSVIALNVQDALAVQRAFRKGVAVGAEGVEPKIC